MRTSRIGVAAATALSATTTALLGAAPAAGASSPIGGPLLGSPGVVEQPLPGAPALPTQLTAASWLVADAGTGQVLAARGAHVKHLPASTLKTLTAVTLIPRLDPRATFAATDRDASVDGTRVGLVPGFHYRIGKLFQAMLVVSANDAADALAQANGGMAKTLADMNAEAAHLQADDTHADTPSGLDGPGESTSAYDLALIARQGLRMPAFRRYVGTVKSRMPAPHHKGYQIYTHNYLLTTYRGDIGIKNGYTVAADATYVGAATRGGRTILVTLMHANPDFWPDARALLTWGFKADGKVTPVGQLVDPVHPTSTQPVAAAAIGRPRAEAGGEVSRNSSLDIALMALGGSVLLLAAVLLRRRRRSPRRRLSLPPI